MAEINKIDADKIAALLQENVESNAKVLKALKDIKKHMHWQKIWSILRFIIIAVPIALGFIYLPPIIKDALQSYKDLFSN